MADPGNKRLRALKDDPALKLVPPGVEFDHQDEHPAYKPMFGGSLRGPEIMRFYVIEDSWSGILPFYAERLPASGWRLERVYDPDHPVVVAEVFYKKNFGSWTGTLQIQIKKDYVNRVALTISAPPVAIPQRPSPSPGTGLTTP